MAHSHEDHHKVPADVTLRVKALETALTRRGYINPDTLEAIIDTYEHKVGPRSPTCHRVTTSAGWPACCPRWRNRDC